MLDFLCFCTNSMIRCEENNKDGVAVYLYFPFRYSACCVTTGIYILSVSPHSVIHSPSPFCPWSTFVSHYVLFLYSCAVALYDCLQSFSLTYSSDLFHLCQLPSFNSCLLLQLGEHITSLTGSLKRMCASFILCSSTMSFLLTVTQVSFIRLPFLPFCFASHILFLTSSFLVFCPRCDLAFSLPSLTSPQGLSCSSLPLWTSRPLPISSILFPLKKERNGSFLPSFHHFSLLMLSSCPSCGNSTTYSSDLSSPRAPFSEIF